MKGVGDSIKGLFTAPETKTGFRYGDLLFLARFARPYRGASLLGLALTAVTTALGSVVPLGSKILIDFVVMGESYDKLGGLLSSLGLARFTPEAAGFLRSPGSVVLAMLAVGVAAGALGLFQRYLLIKVQYGVVYGLQTELFNHVLGFPLSFFRKRTTGYLLSRVSDDIDAFQTLFSQGVVHAVARMFSLAFGLAIAFALSARLALVLVAVLPVYALINRFFSSRLRATSMSEREGTARVSGDIQEVFSGVDTVKAYVQEKKEGARVARSIGLAVGLRMKGMALYFLSSYAVGGVQFLSILLVMWLGVAEVTTGRMTVGDYVAFLSYAFLLVSATKTLSMFHVMLQPAMASLGRLKALFDLAPENGAGLRPEGVRGEVSFRGVSFSYDEGRPALSDVSFEAGPGEIVALVGPSGAGKTTAMNLLLRFYLPQKGAIYLDGRDISGIDPVWLRQRIGIVSQDVFLFNDTIANNIRYGSPDASDEEVKRAARLAGVHDEMAGLPEGYDTVVGERGIALSAGQRQRVSIARAFLKNPAILVLDEPSAALDAATEEKLRDSVKELARGRTTFIIAHRLSLMAIADKVVVLEGGRVVESGTPEKLSREGTAYHRLLKSQAKL